MYVLMWQCFWHLLVACMFYWNRFKWFKSAGGVDFFSDQYLHQFSGYIFLLKALTDTPHPSSSLSDEESSMPDLVTMFHRWVRYERIRIEYVPCQLIFASWIVSIECIVNEMEGLESIQLWFPHFQLIHL